jgi:hypothetical protein
MERDIPSALSSEETSYPLGPGSFSRLAGVPCDVFFSCTYFYVLPKKICASSSCRMTLFMLKVEPELGIKLSPVKLRVE